jgi:SAM-dependent methyltransferase
VRYTSFLREYHTIRHDQGWGRPDAGYFLALPEVAANDPQWAIWRRRTESYHVLRLQVIAPLAERLGRPLRILDLGAGNCWLTYRLTELGHQVAAVDLSADATDGLGAHSWYAHELETRGRSPMTPIQADFNHLPLPDYAVDLALFNASLHYSIASEETLREALRVLAPDGIVVILDSPVYHDALSGEQMVRERESAFERSYGFRSDSLPAEQFLTWHRLDDLACALDLHWRICAAVGGRNFGSLSYRTRRLWRRVRGLRELAELPVIVGARR